MYDGKTLSSICAIQSQEGESKALLGIREYKWWFLRLCHIVSNVWVPVCYPVSTHKTSLELMYHQDRELVGMKGETFGRGSAKGDVRKKHIYWGKFYFSPAMGIYIAQEEGKLGSEVFFGGVCFWVGFFVFLFLFCFVLALFCWFSGFFFHQKYLFTPMCGWDLGAVTGSAFSGFKLIWTSP